MESERDFGINLITGREKGMMRRPSSLEPCKGGGKGVETCESTALLCFETWNTEQECGAKVASSELPPMAKMTCQTW